MATAIISALLAQFGTKKMRDVYIVGLGFTPVREHWSLSLRQLGARAIVAALADAREETAESLYVSNMLAGQISAQENLATLLADESGLLPIEAVRVEAACGSGGAAVRNATLAVASGAVERALAVGVEKMTDVTGPHVAAGLATASDQDFEASFGLSFVAMAGLLMQRYLYETKRSREAFAPFVVNAHRNAMTAEHAMFRSGVTTEQYLRSPMAAEPLSVLDAAPVCDGAAALLLCSKEALRPHHHPIRIAGSAIATDTISLAARRCLTKLQSAETSSNKALRQAQVTNDQIQLFEPHDAFTIMTTLALEACGFAKPGTALDMAKDGAFEPNGKLPICTMGGLKGRGHPVGASGVYQIAEACLQLRGEAGKNQISGVKRAMTQIIGGHGAVAITHILEA
jgi:acetyl-CoA C-acetyltransferase